MVFESKALLSQITCQVIVYSCPYRHRYTHTHTHTQHTHTQHTHTHTTHTHSTYTHSKHTHTHTQHTHTQHTHTLNTHTLNTHTHTQREGGCQYTSIPHQNMAFVEMDHARSSDTGNRRKTRADRGRIYLNKVF